MARPAPAPRLVQGFGLLVDQSRPVDFTFEGRSYRGFEGDVIASALAGCGEWLLSRSFKYHRPRGILSMAGHDANTLVQLPDEPNVLADRHCIAPGLEISGQNYRGSLAHDRGASLRLFSRFLPVGFYYRAFHRPKGAWKRWEPVIRSFAGLGRVNLRAAHRYYDQAYRFFQLMGFPSDLIEHASVYYFPTFVMKEASRKPMTDNSLFFAPIRAFAVLPFDELQ